MRCIEHKARYTTEDILERAGRAIHEGLLNGTTVFRAFTDVDSIGKLRGLEGLLALRERWWDVAHIEVVAFPQEGILRDPGTAELLEEAMRLGADVVGGLPWFERLRCKNSQRNAMARRLPLLAQLRLPFQTGGR